MKKRLSIFLIVVALIAGMAGCAPAQYNLTVSSTEGGEVTSPGERTFTYDEGDVVNLVAEAEEGYRFVNWTGDVDGIANVNDATTTITMNDDYSITADFAVKQYELIISSTIGGEVTTPGEGIFSYDEGTEVDLVAVAEEGYQFVNWTGDVSTIADVNAASTTVTVNGDYTITANFAKGIWDWHDLDAIRNNLGGSYILMNDLDSTTAGYEELAAATANEGKGWEPIGSLFVDPITHNIIDPADPFTGSLDAQGYEIRDLFVSRPEEDGVGLFGSIREGVIENLGVANADVTGLRYVGGLVGHACSGGSTVSNCYITSSVTGVTGSEWIGGLMGGNSGIVRNSYSTGSVTGSILVGGLVGGNWGTVSDSYSTASVIGESYIGGLVGFQHHGTIINSYSSGSVTGEWQVGGLVGPNNDSTVSNSHYSYGEVFINGRNVITIGALFNEDFDQWLANGRSLDVNERLTDEDGYYAINNVSDFKQLLAFGQDGLLKFRLKNDLDLLNEADFYIPYLAGAFDGNGHRIYNLSFSCDFISQVGLFGYLASGGTVTGVGAENVNVAGQNYVGGLVGENDGTVSDCYSTGRVAGCRSIGGLVGWIGWHGGTVNNSYYNVDEVLVNGRNVITIGALFSEDFDQWLANGRYLDVNERLLQEDGYYLIEDVNDLKSLLVFGQNGALKLRLTNDLDLGNEPNFYVPYLAGEFDGNGHKIRNLNCRFDSVSQVGLFGYVGSGGEVSKVGAENINVTATNAEQVGGLVGHNHGSVTNSYSTGSVTGGDEAGGLAGLNSGTVSNSYSACRVTGGWAVGGLVGQNYWSTGYTSTVSNSYSTGRVTSDNCVGGLVGYNDAAVSKSLWDTETSGQTTSDRGGMGRTTAEMKNIYTFSGAGWNIIAVADPDTRNPSYIWNIVDGETYPFLSWQSVG